ncbi:uncharacterized protein METZ01_LOCUS457319 [marine metagenome]|uniref:Uncharacterized protein n=1 Tax=marine metagenome TaxID=408172 RepID=A0A383ABB2_9ZZZZ
MLEQGGLIGIIADHPICQTDTLIIAELGVEPLFDSFPGGTIPLHGSMYGGFPIDSDYPDFIADILPPSFK